MFNFPFHQRELRRDMQSSRFSEGRRGGSSVQTQTCPHACTQAHAPVKAATLFSLSEGRARGAGKPGTSGVTFCPRLLGAPARSSARWADVRHQAGCRAGREHSLTFVEVVLARRKGFFSPFSPALAFPHRLGNCRGRGREGELCVGPHWGEGTAQATEFPSSQGFLQPSKAPKAQRGEDGSPRTHSSLATGLNSNQDVQHPGQGSSGLQPATGLFTLARGGAAVGLWMPRWLGTGGAGVRAAQGPAVGVPRLLPNPPQRG